MIEKDKNATIVIEDEVVINSNNKTYHVNMFGPCKFKAEDKGSIIIGRNSRIHGTCIHARKSISIGSNCLIAANCQIFDSNGHDLCMEEPSKRIGTKGTSKPIVIEANVWLGVGVVVLPGVTIGEGSVISANSVVHKNIPANTIAGGNPVKLIGKNS
ncbi:acyltransferase [Croceivirga radicis]|uniref:acyltransferase n=1 Tax=Croceivirga radicis TaxID=1929488 RepID=UPI0026C32C4C|nr:acyltransferase [Croceivirga radicis]